MVFKGTDSTNDAYYKYIATLIWRKMFGINYRNFRKCDMWLK